MKSTVAGEVPRKPDCKDLGMRQASSSLADRGPEEEPDAGSESEPAPGPARRLLAVSHPAILPVNQGVYRELARRGWSVTLIVPSRWSHAYASTALAPRALDGLEDALRPARVAFPGRPQRHVYLTRCRSVCERVSPDVAFVEAEPFSLAAAQWGLAFKRLGIPFGVQSYENIDRALPLPVRLMRSRVLRWASFVAARSQSAGELARRWGAQGEVALAPPAVPEWRVTTASGPAHRFTVGYAGRLVESKGLGDLLAAVRRLEAPVELLLIGDGELRAELEGQAIPGSSTRVVSGLTHEQMAGAYAGLDVLVLPSRTTPTWKEQFGRVIVEALYCGVPVVGSDSGEIPWVIGLTEGGVIFPEGDAQMLARRLTELRAQPALRRTLAKRGRAAVARC